MGWRGKALEGVEGQGIRGDGRARRWRVEGPGVGGIVKHGFADWESQRL